MQSVTDTGCIHLVAGFTQANRFFTGLLYQSSVHRLIDLENHAELHLCSAAAGVQTTAHNIISKTL